MYMYTQDDFVVSIIPKSPSAPVPSSTTPLAPVPSSAILVLLVPSSSQEDDVHYSDYMDTNDEGTSR